MLDGLLLQDKHQRMNHNQCIHQGQFCRCLLQRLRQLGIHRCSFRMLCSRRKLRKPFLKNVWLIKCIVIGANINA